MSVDIQQQQPDVNTTKPAGGLGMGLLAKFGQKLAQSTKNLILQASENYIEDLNKEISIQKKQYDNDVKFRIENEQDNITIQKQIDQLRVRVEQTRIIINNKRRDPYKVQRITSLRDSAIKIRIQLTGLAETEKNLREEIIDVKAALVVQERIHAELNEKLQKHLDDLEEKVSLETKIQQTLESIEKLKLQLEKLYRLMAKLGKGTTEQIRISETLTTISSILILMNAYERQTIFIENQYMETGVKLYITLDQSRKLISRNNLISDKLPHTLGTLKDDYILGILQRWQSTDLNQDEDTQIEFSKMSVAYFFRIFMVEVKIQEIINYLEQEVKDYEKHKEMLQNQEKKILAIEFEQVQVQDIEEGDNLNKTVKGRMEHFQKLIVEYTDVNELQKNGVDRFQEKIRVKCASEVKERTRLSDILSKDGLQRAHRVVDILQKYYYDVEKVMKIKWLNHHTDYFMGFRRQVMDLTNENNDLTANFHILKLVLDKIKNSQKDIENVDIQKADKIIRKLNKFLDSVLKDHVTLVDIERRLKDLDILYEQFKKIVFEEAKKQVDESLKLRDSQSSELQKKDKDLDAYLKKKREEFNSIKTDIEDDDSDTMTKLLMFEGQLIDACQDGELAHDQEVQIQQKIDRLRRQYQNIGTIDMDHLDDAFEIIDILHGLEIHIVGTEQIIEQAYKKIKDFELNLKDVLKGIRNKRKIDCDKSIIVTFAQLDKLIKLIDKYNIDIAQIQKEQEILKKTGMKDQERDRDTTQFDEQVQARIAQLAKSGKKRDEFKLLIEAYKQNYEAKKDLNESETGSEFQKLQKDSDSLKDQIHREIKNLEGHIYDDILATKVESQALQNKHKYKQEKHQLCMELRAKKNEDFKGWTAHLKSMKARQQKLEDLLRGIQFSREHQQAYDKFRNRLDQNELVVKKADDQIDANARILYSEAADLDVVADQIVKTDKIENIHQLLESLKFLTDTFNDDIENYDADLKQLEKDINDYLNKLKAQSYQDCQNLLDKLDNSLEKLNNKLKEVDGDFDTVYAEFNPIKDKLKNKDTIQNTLNNLGTDQNDIKEKRDKFTLQIKAMKDKFAKIDKANPSVKDCDNILQEGTLLDTQINDEYDKDIEVQERLRKLLMRLRNSGQDEEEKQRLKAKLKALLNDNRDLLKLMKQHIDSSDVKANEFEKLYKSMVDSEDYEVRKPNNEKKLVKVRGIKAQTEKYTGLRQDAEKQMDKLTDDFIDGIEEIDDLEDILKDQTKLNEALKGYVKILGDIVKGLDRRRLKTQDAEVRKNANKHQKLHDDIQEIAKKTQANLSAISDQVKGQSDKTKGEELEKQLNEYQGRFNSFKTKFDKVSAELKSLVDEIKPKDLEATESVAKLAEYIDRLRGIGQALKELKAEIDKLLAETDEMLANLSSLGTEKALRDLINRILEAQKNNQEIMDHIKRMIALTDSYDGYTTGAEDGKFFSGLNGRSKKLLTELKEQDAQFTKTQGDIEKIILVVRNDKKTGDPAKDNALNEKRKGEIASIKGLVDKLIDAKVKIDDEAIGNKKKMSDYILEEKVGRRKEEVDELERQHDDFAGQILGSKTKAQEEIEANTDKPGQKANVEKLTKALQELVPLEESMQEMVVRIQDLQVECSNLGEAIESVDPEANLVEVRLNYYDQHLALKKKIRDLQKELKDLWSRVSAWVSNIAGLLGQEPVKAPIKLAFKITDDIDKMIAEILNRLGIPVPISKIGGGYYMFGSKKIFCKIINGKLVVRVGGGYMGIEEFIMTYGKQEVDKAGLIKNLEEQVKANGNSNFSAASMVNKNKKVPKK